MTRQSGGAHDAPGRPAMWRRAVARAHRKRAPHSRAPQSARKEDRECCGNNHNIEPRAVQAEIHDGSQQQRKQENPRYSCDRCYQLKSPVEARFSVSPLTLRLTRKSIAFRFAVTREFALQSRHGGRSPKARNNPDRSSAQEPT